MVEKNRREDEEVTGRNEMVGSREVVGRIVQMSTRQATWKDPEILFPLKWERYKDGKCLQKSLNEGRKMQFGLYSWCALEGSTIGIIQEISRAEVFTSCSEGVFSIC